ncbi:hypothetical protein INR77_11235 [Erythrobacter sp. SCSIO 43205]|uniref:hypothetical protein n=1 Tax=Erythrobacter sp. SCSIO 43205 TaxID=2779361 RepID=UPI001CA8789C|nr:hypothetical protein [Erythrobacter sp. SCSIO 43205]UAB77378.1 hypothetical protein INR77_11235 [Erythrobacter sp. SCSIO 43205]
MIGQYRDTLMTLAVGIPVLAGMIIKHGGLKETWNQNNGGLIITITVILIILGHSVRKDRQKVAEIRKGQD